MRALAPHIHGGEAAARDAARDLPRVLYLGFNGIGAEGATAIASHLPPTLKELNLTDNGIGAAGARTLASHLPETLQKLWLGGNGIGCSDEEVLLSLIHI